MLGMKLLPAILALALTATLTAHDRERDDDDREGCHACLLSGPLDWSTPKTARIERNSVLVLRATNRLDILSSQAGAFRVDIINRWAVNGQTISTTNRLTGIAPAGVVASFAVPSEVRVRVCSNRISVTTTSLFREELPPNCDIRHSSFGCVSSDEKDEDDDDRKDGK